MDRFAAHIEASRERYYAELCELLRQPSIAAQGVGIDETSAIVARRLEQLGARVQMLRLPGAAPVVYGSLGRGARTLLIYDHYDVQPPEPLELWQSPAFEPTIRDGKLYARGVADNKGNLMLRLQAIESWLATEGELPITINFLVEGEEEIGSIHLEQFCHQHADLLRADGCLWETGGRNALEQPAINCGAKGICYVELMARGASHDLHSSNATVVPNPAWRLTWALATLKGPDERILIPGFYDRVRPPSAADLRALESIPLDDQALLADFGEHGLTVLMGAKPLKAFTKKTIQSVHALARECESIRNIGYATDESEYLDGVRCVAAPIRDRDGAVIASIGISAPAVRFPREREKEYAAKVLAAATQIGEAIRSLDE